MNQDLRNVKQWEDFYFKRGNIYLRENDFARAKDCYTVAIAINCNGLCSYVNRANCSFKLGAIDESIKNNLKAIGLSPKFIKCHLNYNICKLYAGLPLSVIEDNKKTCLLMDELVQLLNEFKEGCSQQDVSKV